MAKNGRLHHMEHDMTAWETVCAQLTLRAVIWDVCQVKADRLEREMKKFPVQLLKMDECERAGVESWTAYEKIIRRLQNLTVLQEQALLVTEDEGLAEYVYSLRHKQNAESARHQKESDKERRKAAAGGMAVVFYEREGSRRDVPADMTVLGFEEIGVQFLDRIQKRANGLPWNILYTERTLVREIMLSDLDELYALYEEKGITDYTEPLYEREKEEAYIKEYIRCMYYYYGYGMWIIRDRITGALIGRAGIDHHDEDGVVLMELGYIISTKYQKKGYAAEVCRAVIEYARQELEAEQLHCFIHCRNQASVHVAEKLGFTLQHGNGGQKDMLHYRLILNAE